jgi:hypothetical protein
MNIIRKLGLFHWNIGFAEETPETILGNQRISKKINWLQDDFRDRFFADPFILNVTDNAIEVLVEEYMYSEQKGRITALTIDRKNYTLFDHKVLLDLETHLSFPFIFRENNRIYVIPENCRSGALSIYEYNTITKNLEFRKVLITSPLVDPVIVKHEGLYYLLCTRKDKNENEDLYIYYSNDLMGDYREVSLNPVKSDVNSTRSASDFFINNGSLYRFAQKNQNFYGEGLSINKVIVMTKEHYEEQMVAVIYPDKKYRYGIHTLNNFDDITIIDGLKYIFSPIEKRFPFHAYILVILFNICQC